LAGDVSGNIAGDFFLYTAELPYRNNLPNISRILPGLYQCSAWRPCDPAHAKFTAGYFRVYNVPGRAGILIHQGNYAGDKARGFKSDVAGCILLGLGASQIHGQNIWKDIGQDAVLDSKKAMAKLREITGNQGFTLNILEDFSS
jgi:hypothetical protein